MKLEQNSLVLLLIAIVSVSIIHCKDGEIRSYNRSKIHISIDVDSNSEKSLKGRYTDLSQGEVKGIDISKEDDDGDDDDDNLDDDADDDEDKDDGKDGNDKNNGKGTVKHVGKENFAEITKSKDRDSKNVKNSSFIRKHGKKSSRKTKASKEKNRKQRGKKVLKNRKKIWKVKKKGKKAYSKNGKEKGSRKSKQRSKKRKKKDKYVPNPEGSPNPHNLKIPLTFNREDIHDESAQNETQNENNGGKSTQNVTSNISKTFDDGVTAKISNPGDAIEPWRRKNLDNAATLKQGKTLTGSATSNDNQNLSNETSTSDVSASNDNQAAIDRNGKDNNAEASNSQDAATDSNSKAASKIRDLTKEIVITTLKEVKKISDSANSTDVNVKNPSGSPLLERMGK